jgi:hypothetical protein
MARLLVVVQTLAASSVTAVALVPDVGATRSGVDLN